MRTLRGPGRVELGQLFVLALAIPALALFFRYGVRERMGTIILSAFVAHTAWHWMLERGAVLAHTGHELPIVEADLDNLESVIREVVANRPRYQEVARHGPAFVRAVHDGEVSRAVLEREFLYA